MGSTAASLFLPSAGLLAYSYLQRGPTDMDKSPFLVKASLAKNDRCQKFFLLIIFIGFYINMVNKGPPLCTGSKIRDKMCTLSPPDKDSAQIQLEVHLK
jgi:hypothetical protein